MINSLSQESNISLLHKEKENETKIELGARNGNTDELIYFNVSGRSFTTTTFTLDVFPDALLGNKKRRDDLPRTKNGEIFLNRHPDVFASVLTFYQTGIFDVPVYVNQKVFVRDVVYYGLDSEAKESGLRGFGEYIRPMPRIKWQAQGWKLLEYPDSSIPARIVSLSSLLVIIISIVMFCWETMPGYKNLSSDHINYGTIKTLENVEIFCITYFTLELILRLFFSPNKWAFVKDILNIIDLITILPFYITLLYEEHEGISIYFLRAIRLARVFRVFKLSRHSNEMKILGIAVKDSVRELGVLLFFILLGVLLFSSAIYYAENAAEGTHLDSIPGAFWWSIVTMTTVGYGDVYPKSTAGQLVGAVCAMTGILVIAMPIPIIVNNFTRHYQRLKPVSKYWEEFQDREKFAPKVRRPTIGLFKLSDFSTFQDLQDGTDVSRSMSTGSVLYDGNFKSCTNDEDKEPESGLK